MKGISLILLLSLALLGCASKALTTEEAMAADYGNHPSNYEEIVTDWFYETLKDPDSAKYRFESEPTKAYTRKAPVAGGGISEFGYYIKVLVNAKNSYGGYTGWEEYRLLIRDDKVVTSFIPNMYFSEDWYQ